MNQNLRRKARCVMANNAEWDAISAKANALGISKSRLLIETALTPSVNIRQHDSVALPESAQWDLLRELLVLAAIAEDNLQQRGDVERLAQIREKVHARIKSYELGF